ncbi:hypothetical protein [Methanocella sp. MCL-LM]|uniref:hypothetical protein n=1 Tax=Methanocella sp. MCL-LM TaxID=3412035 RepID=UPI003C746FF0
MMRIAIIYLVLALALACFTQAACAEVAVPVNIGIPYAIGPGFTLAAPFSQGSYIINAFNKSTLAYTGTKSLAISLASADAGPGFRWISANPTIAQTSAESLVMDRSYFFNDFVSAA